jgi:hypothetical protein
MIVRRHRALAVASLAAVALAAAAAVIMVRADADRGVDAGPLACRGCSIISVSLPVKTGELVVAGDMDVVNPGPHPIVLDRVRPLRRSTGLVLDQVRVVTFDHPDAGRSSTHHYTAVYPYLVRLCAFPSRRLEHSCPNLPTR